MIFSTLGDPDRCAEELAAGLALARDLGHPPTLVVAQHVASQMYQMRGDAVLAYKFAKEATELAEEYGLELWRAYGIIEMGWAEAELGNLQHGIEEMQRGLTLHEGMSSQLRSPYFLGLLTDQLAKAGRVEDGLATIEKALLVAGQTGERYSLPELYRLKGELLAQAAESRRAVRDTALTSLEPSTLFAQAKACFAEALAVAKEQQALSWELKITASLERLDRRVASQKPGE
jgi:predicted ATPase